MMCPEVILPEFGNNDFNPGVIFLSSFPAFFFCKVVCLPLPHFLNTKSLLNHRHSVPVHVTPLKLASQMSQWLLVTTSDGFCSAFILPVSHQPETLTTTPTLSEFYLPWQSRGCIVTISLPHILIFLFHWFYFLFPSAKLSTTQDSILSLCFYQSMCFSITSEL